MLFVVFGIFPILLNAQILVTDLVDAVNSDGILIKYLENESDFKTNLSPSTGLHLNG